MCSIHEDIGSVYPFKRAYLDKIVKVLIQPKTHQEENRIYRSVLCLPGVTRTSVFESLEKMLAEAKETDDLEGLTLLATLCEQLINMDRGVTLMHVLKHHFAFFFTCLSHSPANIGSRRGPLFMQFLFGENPCVAPIDFLNLYQQKENLSKIFDKDEPELQALVDVKAKLYFLFKLVLMNNPEFADSAVEKEVNDSSSVAILKELIQTKAIRKMLFENFYDLKPSQMVRLLNEVRGLFHEIRRKEMLVGFASQLQELQVPSLCLKRVCAMISEDSTASALPPLIGISTMENENSLMAIPQQANAETVIDCKEMLSELFAVTKSEVLQSEGEAASRVATESKIDIIATQKTISTIEAEDCSKPPEGISESTLTPPTTNSPAIEDVKGTAENHVEDQELAEQRPNLILSYLELALLICRETPRSAKKVFVKIDFPGLVHYSMQQANPSFLLAIKDLLIPPFSDSQTQYELIDSLTEQQMLQRGLSFLQTLTQSISQAAETTDGSEQIKSAILVNSAAKARVYFNNYLLLANVLLKCISLTHMKGTWAVEYGQNITDIYNIVDPGLQHKEIQLAFLELFERCLSSRIKLITNMIVPLSSKLVSMLKKFQKKANLVYSKALAVWSKLPSIDDLDALGSMLEKVGNTYSDIEEPLVQQVIKAAQDKLGLSTDLEKPNFLSSSLAAAEETEYYYDSQQIQSLLEGKNSDDPLYAYLAALKKEEASQDHPDTATLSNGVLMFPSSSSLEEQNQSFASMLLQYPGEGGLNAEFEAAQAADRPAPPNSLWSALSSSLRLETPAETATSSGTPVRAVVAQNQQQEGTQEELGTSGVQPLKNPERPTEIEDGTEGQPEEEGATLGKRKCRFNTPLVFACEGESSKASQDISKPYRATSSGDNRGQECETQVIQEEKEISVVRNEERD